MQQFLGDPDSGMLNLEAHRLALAIAKEDFGWELLQNHTENHGQDTTLY